MTIYLGADHGGFKLKAQLKQWLAKQGVPFQDCGALTLDPQDDYPQYAFAVAEKVVAREPDAKGVILCRSGDGVVIAANKVKGCRAAAVNSVENVKYAIEHDDVNVIAFGGDHMSLELAEQILEAFITTEFPGAERHIRRVRQIEEYESHRKN